MSIEPETSAAYQQEQLDLFSPYSTEKHSLSPPKKLRPDHPKEEPFEIRYPFVIDRKAEEQDFYEPLDKDQEVKVKEIKEPDAERYSLPKEIFVNSKDPSNSLSFSLYS